MDNMFVWNKDASIRKAIAGINICIGIPGFSIGKHIIGPYNPQPMDIVYVKIVEDILMVNVQSLKN